MATLDADDKKWLLENLGPTAMWAADVDPGPAKQTAYGALFTALARTGAVANTLLPGLISAVAEVAEGQIDPEELAALVVAKLPANGDPVTPLELQQAIVGAARELIGLPAS